MHKFLAWLFGLPKFVSEMARVQVGEHDVIVLSVDVAISDDTAQRLREHIQTILGADQKVLVLGDGLKLGVLGRPCIALAGGAK